MINFLNPIFLLGLVAAAVPLIIHFLSRYRAQRRDFSSLMLLREVQSRNVRKLRTRQWLLLILRTLIIILLILVPARPLVRGLFGSGATDHLPTSAVFILDTSASTGFVDDRGSAFSFLTGRLQQILGWMNPADRFRILTADEDYTDLDGAWRSPGEPQAREAARLEKLHPGFRGTRLAVGLEAASRMFLSSGETVAREVYLFTDCQTGFLGTDSLRLADTQAVRFYIVQAHGRSPGNISVEKLGLPGELVRPGTPLKVTVGVANYGSADSVRVFPRLYLDDRLVGQGEASLAAGEKAPVVIELPPVEQGLRELTAETDADGLAADNRRTILLKVPSRTRVVLVETRKAEPDYLGSALEVLSRGAGAPLTLERRSDLPLPGRDFKADGVFIIHGLDFPEARLNAFLNEAARLACRLVIIPRAGLENEENYDRVFGAVASRLDLPFELSGPSSFGPGGFDSPALTPGAAASGAVYGPLLEAIPGMEKLKVYALRRLPPATGGTAGGQAVAPAWDLNTVTGATLLRLVRRGGLSALLVSCDLADPLECELPITPLFIPLLHSLVTLAGDSGPLVKPDRKAGEPASIYFGNEINSSSLEVHGPGDNRYLLPPGEYDRLEFDNTSQPGIYRIYEGQRMTGAFAVGLDPREADLRIESEQQVRRKFGRAELKIIPADSALEDAVFLSRGGVEVWPALLVLVLGLLIVEQIVANRNVEGEE